MTVINELTDTPKTAAELYLEMIESRPPEIVEVKAPSGFVFKFLKLGVFGVIFDERAGLPQTAASKTAESWKQKGVLTEPEGEEEPGTEQIKPEKRYYDTVDRVCELSFEPKIVLGEPKEKGEISYKNIDPDDLAYLYKFVAAGGNVSLMLTMFPEGREQRTLASANRPKQRHKSK